MGGSEINGKTGKVWVTDAGLTFGIPVTQSDLCSSVHIISVQLPEDKTHNIDFAALTEMGGTMVFMTDLSSLSVITSGLLRAGMDPDTPSAVFEKGTASDSYRIFSSVSELVEAAARSEPAERVAVVVGEAAAQADGFEWHDNTEPFSQPIFLDDPSLYQVIKKVKGWGYEWIVFTSPAGVKAFMHKYLEKYDIRSLTYGSIACEGEDTRLELLKHGIQADMVIGGDEHVPGENLARRLRRGDRVLIPGSSAGNQELVKELSTAYRAEIEEAAFYKLL